MRKALTIKLIAALFFLFTTTPSHAQTTVIQGTVQSESAKKAIPFVNIGIKKKGVGTAADADGQLTLKLGREFLGDTLTFSAIGYQELSLSINAIAAGNMQQFILQEKATALQEVHVISKAPKIRKFGTTSRNPLLWGNAQSRNSNDISEFAKLIKSMVKTQKYYLQLYTFKAGK